MPCRCGHVRTSRKTKRNHMLSLFLVLVSGTAGFGQAATPLPNYGMLRDAAELISKGDLARAETEIQIVLRQAPNDARALNMLGIVRAQQRRNPEAESLFKQAIQQEPGFTSARVDLGLLYVQAGQAEQAIPQLTEALRQDPGRTDASNALSGIYREQARAAVQARDSEKALALLIQARKISPKDPNTLFDFGMVTLRMSLFPDAIKAFQEVLEIRKDDSSAIYGLGRALMGEARFEDACSQFQRYVQLRPNDASGHYALGLTLVSLQQNDEARREFDESLRLAPMQTESYFQLGLLDLAANRLEEAEARFHHVLERDPNHAGALAGLGQVEFLKKDYPRAVEWLKGAVTKDPGLRQAHYYLGLSYARMGRKQEADTELQAATRLDQEEVKRHQRNLQLEPEPNAGSPRR